MIIYQRFKKYGMSLMTYDCNKPFYWVEEFVWGDCSIYLLHKPQNDSKQNPDAFIFCLFLDCLIHKALARDFPLYVLYGLLLNKPFDFKFIDIVNLILLFLDVCNKLRVVFL